MVPLLAQLNLDDPALKGYIAIAMGVFGLVYLMYRGAAKKRRDPLERSAFGGSVGLAQQRAVERQMQGLLVEMADMARQISAQLDTRAARLEDLIRQADERLAAMKMGAGESEPLGGRGPMELPAGDVPREPITETAAPFTGAQETPAFTVTSPEHADIYALADAGRSPVEIARELSRPRGEVELILALRPKPAA